MFLKFTHQVCQSVIGNLPALGASDRILVWIPGWQSRTGLWSKKVNLNRALFPPLPSTHVAYSWVLMVMAGWMRCGQPHWALGLGSPVNLLDPAPSPHQEDYSWSQPEPVHYSLIIYTWNGNDPALSFLRSSNPQTHPTVVADSLCALCSNVIHMFLKYPTVYHVTLKNNRA